MLFRNPFRLTSGVPWKPAGDTIPIWDIDRDRNILSLSAIEIGKIKYSERYNETVFGTAMLSSEDGRQKLHTVWTNILGTLEKSFPIPLAEDTLTAVAVSLSFGLDDKKLLCDDRKLLHNFVAYLKLALEGATFARYIPEQVALESQASDGFAFGKPVWDFEYPDSSIYITDKGAVGCCISETQPDDIVIAALGSSYPHVLRPSGTTHRIRGYSYMHGAMNAEHAGEEVHIFNVE